MKELKIKNLAITQSVAEQAIKAAMSFKDTPEGASYYFRDCLIGTTANIYNLILITNNIKDFAWLPQESCLTPTQIMIKLTEEL